MRLEEEREWTSTWALEPWLEMAGTPEQARARIRELVGAPGFDATAWMARFGRGSAVAGRTPRRGFHDMPVPGWCAVPRAAAVRAGVRRPEGGRRARLG